MFNPNGNGMIPNEQVGPAVRALLGKNPTEKEMREMIKEFDREGTGQIDFSDFLSLTAGLLKEQTTEEELVEAFRVFDREGEGTISANKLHLIMANLGEKLTANEIDELVREADIENNNSINYEKFLRIMMSR